MFVGMAREGKTVLRAQMVMNGPMTMRTRMRAMSERAVDVFIVPMIKELYTAGKKYQAGLVE